jgi:DNA-binding response OmpR family regulator
VAPLVPILVVDDEELIRALLQEVLADRGFAVTMASTGAEAMTFLNRDGAGLGALITDINLPDGVTGWDVARRAREISETLPIIYITGASSCDWSSKGVPNSFLLTKPFALARVVTVVSQLINAAGNSI